MEHEHTAERGTSRRKMLAVGGAVLAGTLAGCSLTSDDDDEPSANGAPAQSSGSESESLLARIKKDKKIRLGVDLTFAPLQFRDPDTNEPTGYSIEVVKLLAQALGAEPEWVEVPFADLFSAQAAGRFDIAGIAAVNTPERAQQVAFAYAPTFLEGNYLFQRKGLNLSDDSALNDSGITIAAVVGTSQSAAAKLLYPKAKIKELPDYPAALADVSTNRSDVLFVGEYAAAEAADKGLSPISRDPVAVAWNTFFLPLGDVAMHQFITVFLQNKAADLTLADLWQRFVAADVEKQGLRTAAVKDPYLSAA
ncbi:MAG TPA: transporter substrate-binding domain-containing protein [Solirubrobacter sp.]|nr:transporter substrate-binding domain-containing protein [Solirubrobacter sp.]